MINKLSIEGSLTDVIEEATTRFEGDDAANAIAFVVQETDINDREKALQAVADGLDTDDLSRQDRRELFLLQRTENRRRINKRIARRAVGISIAARRY